MKNLLQQNSSALQYIALASIIIVVAFLFFNISKQSRNIQEGLTDRQLDAKRQGLDDQKLLNSIVSDIETAKNNLLFDDYADYYKSVLESAREKNALDMLNGVLNNDKKKLKESQETITQIDIIVDSLFDS